MNDNTWTGILVGILLVLIANLGWTFSRKRLAKPAVQIIERSETEWCVLLETLGRKLFDAKRDYHAAYVEVSEALVTCPDHLRPLVEHQLQLAQIHDKVVAKALAKQGVAIETAFGDPAIAAMPVADATRVASEDPENDEALSGEFGFDLSRPSPDAWKAPPPKQLGAWSRRRS